ncbi:helix-turn-helix domain-containing protein [Bosea sp. 685]|uniref:TetR/AcrR family transcriptional regulator n=1 Tax=Bosea sp. 685 TaxID=3080057 RepID=UPI0028937BEA|nr:helix-turn-helix domain-containing protein [Bosea sp. 685]WNJ89756.1 helix-turn-helix domain-containing protein [Bosea sp. 685]
MADSTESSGTGANSCAEDATTRIDQIADAALRRFARYGFKRTSMDDIAKEAGLAKATLYLHFKGKDDVFRAMMLRTGQRVDARCRRVMAMAAPFPERLAALLDAHFGTGYACFGAGEHLLELKAVMTSVASAEVQAFEDIFTRHATELLERAEAAGEISLSRSGLSTATFVATLMQAAAGAKAGAKLSCETYGARLRDLASVFAAALAPTDRD